MTSPTQLNSLHHKIKLELEKLCAQRNERGASELLLVVTMRLPQLMKDHLEQIKDMLIELNFIDDPDDRTLWYKDILRFILFPNAESEEDMNMSEEVRSPNVAVGTKKDIEVTLLTPVIEDSRCKDIDLSGRLLN